MFIPLFMDILPQNSRQEILLSVIVPAYNCEVVLKRCILSILKSIDKDSEIIIVNDGSTDNTLTVAHSLSAIYSNIKIVSQKNQGVSAARNKGIEYSRGRYVAFVDADDWIESPYTIFRTLLETIVATNADLVITGYSTSCKEYDLDLKNELYIKKDGKDFERLILLNSIGKPYGKLIYRDFLIKNNIYFPVGMKHQEDAVFLYKMLRYATMVATVHDKSYYYQLPDRDKTYAFSLNEELKGYEEMSDAVDALCDSLANLSSLVKKRLENRKINMTLHVYNSILREPNRSNRIEAYKKVAWNEALISLNIHPLKKVLLFMHFFQIADLISNKK